MSKTNSFETAFLEHIFQNANIALIGDATGVRGSSTAGWKPKKYMWYGEFDGNTWPKSALLRLNTGKKIVVTGTEGFKVFWRSMQPESEFPIATRAVIITRHWSKA